MSYDEFQRYLCQQPSLAGLKVDVGRDLIPQMQKMVTDTVRATYAKIDPARRVNCMEIFGYDFMIDD